MALRLLLRRPCPPKPWRRWEGGAKAATAAVIPFKGSFGVFNRVLSIIKPPQPQRPTCGVNL